MTLANPWALLWGLLAIPIVMLYLRRTRVQREPTATAMIWDRVLAEEPMRTWWQRWREPVSLAVQLCILALLVIALADPQVPALRPVAMILDGLVGLCVLLLVVEWCLYQRRWLA